MVVMCLVHFTLAQESLDIDGEFIVRDAFKIGTFRSSTTNSFIRIETNNDPARGVSIGYLDSFGSDPCGSGQRKFYIDAASDPFGEITIDPGCPGGESLVEFNAGVYFYNSIKASLPPGNGGNIELDLSGRLVVDNSSRRDKINIHNFSDNWNNLYQVRPVIYQRPDNSDSWDIGYIAEELDSLGLKSLVGYDQINQPSYIDYDKISIYLVELLKVQQSEMENLKARIEELETNNIGTVSKVLLDQVRKLSEELTQLKRKLK